MVIEHLWAIGYKQIIQMIEKKMVFSDGWNSFNFNEQLSIN